MRAVIFDMDGVIVNSEPVHERAFLDVARQLGYAHNHGIRFTDYIGRADRELWLEFIGRHKPAQSLEELCALKRARVIEIVQREQPVFEGIPWGGSSVLTETVARLSDSSWRLAVLPPWYDVDTVDDLRVLRQQSPAQTRRRRDPDARMLAASVESDRDSAGEVQLPRL